MVVFFKIRFWNKLPIEFEVENVILSVHIPSNSEMVDVASFFVRIMSRIYLSFVSSVIQPRADNPMTLKNAIIMNILLRDLFVPVIYCFHLT